MPTILYRGKGCELCGYSGYSGRTGIFEALLIEEELKYLIASKELSLEKMRSVIRKAGFKTMFEDALNKIFVGITTLEEALRVIG